MENVSTQVKYLLERRNIYSGDITSYCAVLSFLPWLEDIKEEDYIIYHDNHTFEYTAEFYSFIKSLFDAGLVEDVDVMTDFLKNYNSCCAYKLWMKELNYILSNKELLQQTNLCFIKKAVFSMIRLERVLPGSWGIDIEAGNWLAILQQLKRILKEIYYTEKKALN